MFKKCIYIFAFSFLSVSTLNAQFTDEFRYLSVISYLRTNTQVNEQIKEWFPHKFFPQIAGKKEKFVEFNLDSTIFFIGISDFQKRLAPYIESEPLLTNETDYSKKYYFKPEKSFFLGKLIEKNIGKLFLTFSKPVNDFLIVEFTLEDPELYSGWKGGPAMDIFFKFDKFGLVENVEYAGAHYH